MKDIRGFLKYTVFTELQYHVIRIWRRGAMRSHATFGDEKEIAFLAFDVSAGCPLEVACSTPAIEGVRNEGEAFRKR